MKKLIFILLCFSLMTFGSSAKIIEVAPAGAWGIGLIGGGGANAFDKTDATLKGLWYFEEDLTDETTNGNNLSASGTLSYAASSPNPATTNDSQAYSVFMEAANHEHAESDSADLDPNDDMSVGCWFYPNNITAEMALFSKNSTTSELYGWRLYLEGNDANDPTTLRYSLDGTSTTTYTVNSLYAETTWIHLVVVFDGSGENNVRLYKNGSEVTGGNFPGANTGTVYNPDIPFMIGDWDGSNFELDGYADECFYFQGKALSDAEVLQIYTYGFE